MLMLFDHIRRPLVEVVVNASPQGSLGVEAIRFWCKVRRREGRGRWVCDVVSDGVGEVDGEGWVEGGGWWRREEEVGVSVVSEEVVLESESELVGESGVVEEVLE